MTLRGKSLADLTQRLIAGAGWRARQIGLAYGGRRLRAATRLLGFPEPPFGPSAEPAGPSVAQAQERPSGAGIFPRQRAGVCGATVCTVDHLHFALALAASFRRHHPDLPLHLLVVDGDDVDLPAPPGVVIHRGSEVGLFDDPYLALKLTAFELCCAAKPFLLLHLAATTEFAHAIYLDADIRLFAPCDRLREELAASTVVVFPHTLEPFPSPERWWERPAFAELGIAGVLNAGLFGIDLGEEGRRFLAQWRDLASGFGAFSLGQTEQNAFNWVLAFVERVRVLRDTAYNAAYWNLHDRSLRWHGAAHDRAEFTVDGKPLVAFHFSGYRPDAPRRLSAHDGRHPAHCDRAVTELLALYRRELRDHGADHWSAQTYRFDRFPSGIPIDARLRHLFRVHEGELHREVDPFSTAGEAAYCRALLSPSSRTGSLLPLLLASLRADRVDLRAAFPDADLDPRGILSWFADNGAVEAGYAPLFDAHRAALPRPTAVRALLRARAEMPAAFHGLREPLGRDRRALVERLRAATPSEGAQPDTASLAVSVQSLTCEISALSPLYALRGVVESRPDLRAAYPDLLDGDAPALAAWLRLVGTRTELVTNSMVQRFERAAGGRSLARLFSFVDRHPAIIEPWPLALVGEGRAGFARALLQTLGGGVEYDLDDVVMYLWLMDEKPWAGLSLTLELKTNANRVPSPLLPEGEEALLGPLLADDRFQQALEAHRRRHGSLALVEPSRSHGVNLFGYFKSPIGLGTMSRGLALALRRGGVTVRDNVVTNQTMDADLESADFVRRYDPCLDTNLFVSFPHLEERLLDGLPRHRAATRFNVVYLAWEQREANRSWAEAYAEFDQVWALSDFAASGLRQALGREVFVVPCVVDVAPPGPADVAAARARHGLARRVVFLHTFDANSSIERKNPEAVLQAFARAFRGDDDATLVLRASNGHRREHQPRLRQLRRSAAASGLDVRFVDGPLDRDEILALAGAADCYVSLHHAEGFGLTCAEAMALGKPVIATGYSGNLEFMDDDNSLLVAAQEIEVRRAEGPFRRGSLWAEPDVDHAAAHLRRVFEDREGARELGERARRAIQERLSPERVGALAAATLQRLWGATRSTHPACSASSERHPSMSR